MANRNRIAALLAVLGLVASACGSSATPSPSAAPSTGASPEASVAASPSPAPSAAAVENYPRAETLYTSGKQYGAPSTWNPLDPNAAMGTVGLQYETLFLYDPLADQFTPWLAESGTWTDANTYTIKIRQGVQWSDGQPFTADDVAFTIGLATSIKALGSNLSDFGTTATATDASTVVVKFTNPAYQEWSTWTYNSPIVPKHIWASLANEDILKTTNENGVGTGPYMYKTHADDRMVWVKNPNWWGIAAGHPVMPTYIVDIVNGANSTALGMVLQGGLDLSNNFLPGVAELVNRGYVQTYFPSAPYMLSANTAWLVPNTKKAPLNDPQFRIAIADAINVNDVISKDYGGIVSAANPTGLLPSWDKYVDKNVVAQLGPKYDPAKAKSILAAAGYKTGGDGFVTNKDGSPIKLTISVPTGWSDWEVARDIIISSLKAVGINTESKPLDYNGLVAARNSGDFDLLINNDMQLANTPWGYYDYIFHMPLITGAGENRNFEGYENPDAWALVQQLDKTPVTDVTTMQSIMSKLQTIQLTNEPIIPMWYNGLWSQVSNSVWTNWPCSAATCNHYLPATWNGYWQMGAVLMLTQLKPVPPAQ
jgi:peptide/nickel transport system substrate-binding protein